MDIRKTGRCLLGAQQHIVKVQMPILVSRDGIDRDCAHILGLNQVVERSGGRLLIQGELLNRPAHDEQVLLQHGFSGAQNGFLILPDGDAGQNHDHRNDDQEFEKGKPRRSRFTTDGFFGAIVFESPEDRKFVGSVQYFTFYFTFYFAFCFDFSFKLNRFYQS